MPGLRLTAPQVTRLCGVESELCRRVLAALVETRFLRLTAGGAYARLTDGATPSARPVKATLSSPTRIRAAS